MSCSIITAKDEMYAMFKSRWDSRSGTIVNSTTPYIPHVYYDGLNTPAKPPTNLFCAKIEMNSKKESPSCFRNNLDGLQNVRYNCTGLLEINIFCPLSDKENADKGLRLSIVARDSYSAKQSPSGVNFYNVSIKGPIKYSEVFAKFTITTDYKYFDVRTSA